VRELVKKYARELGTTVLLSSHNMAEVEELCTRVALIHTGRVLEQGEVGELLVKHGARNMEELFVKLVRGGGS